MPRIHMWLGLLPLLTAGALFLAVANPAGAMTVTFVRHGESEGNSSGFIDTSVPGPELTDLGRQQAQDIAEALAGSGITYDGIYYSDMIRTKQTSQPLQNIYDNLPTAEFAGFHEISAGIMEGQSENGGIGRLLYALAPLSWVFGLRFIAIPGAENGNNLDARVDGALKAIRDDGEENPVVFSHGGTIMFWTLMNVKNPDLSLMLKAPLSNTDTVTVTGNPTDGWTLVSWAGRAVTQNPALLTKLMVNVRDLIATPQIALFNAGQALRSGNIAALANAVRNGVFNTLGAVVKFPINVVKSVVKSLATGTLIKGAKPPADAVVPPTGSQLGDATGVPSAAATNAALATTTESVATKRRAVAAVKPVHVDVADSTVAAQKSGADAPANVTDAKSDDTKSDDAKSDDANAKADNGKLDKKSGNGTKRSDRKKDRRQGAGKAHASAASSGSSSGKSGSASGHHGGHK